MPIYTFEHPDTGQEIQVWAENKDMAVQKFMSAKGEPRKFTIQDPRTNVTQEITAYDENEAAEIAKRTESGGVGTQLVAGGNVGASQVLGLPVDLITGGINLARQPLGMEPIKYPFGGSEHLLDVMESPQILRDKQRLSDYAPQTALERQARRAGEYIGGSAVPAAGFARIASNVGRNLAGQTAATLAASTAEQAALDFFGGEYAPLAQMFGIGASFVPGGLSSKARKSQPFQQAIKEMRNTSSNLYANIRADKRLAIDPTLFKGMEDDAFNFARQEGFTFIDDKGVEAIKQDFTKAKEVLSTLRARDRQNLVTGAQAMSDRKSIQKAISDAEGQEKALLGYIWNQYTNRIGPKLGPEFSQANELWRRSSNADKILTELNIADLKAEQGRDIYAAIKSKLSTLLDRIERGYEPFFNPSEVQAIRQAARQTTPQSIGILAEKFGFTSSGLGFMRSGGLAAGAGAYTGDPFTAGATALGLQGLASTGTAVKTASQSRRVNQMMQEVINNPKLSEQAKRQLINAISTYYGAEGVRDVGQQMEVMP